MEIPSVQHAAFHGFLNVVSLEFEFLQGCVQVLQTQTMAPPRFYYVTEHPSHVRGKVLLYQQLFVGKSTRDGPSVPIFLPEVIDELDNLLLQVSFNVNLCGKGSNCTLLADNAVLNDSQKYLSTCRKPGKNNNNCS